MAPVPGKHTATTSLSLHGLDGDREDLRDSMVWGGDEDLLPIATIQGQIGSVSDQPSLVGSITVLGWGLERDIL